MIWVKMLGILEVLSCDYVVDDGENGSENESAGDVGGPMLVGEDAADGDEDDERGHDEVEDAAEGL